MRPDQAEFLLLFLLPQLESEQAITRKILAAVPVGQESYRPNAKAMSAIGLAWHIAAAEIWFLTAVINREFGDFTARPDDLKTCREVALWYEQKAASVIPLLTGLSGDELKTPVNFLGLRNDPAVAYLNIAIRHSVHHRGQLTAYLRGMNAPVPAIYVESADEPYPPDSEIDPSTAPAPPAF